MIQNGFSENNQVSLPLGRTLICYVCEHGVTNEQLSDDEWVSAQNIEQACHSARHNIRGNMNGGSIQIDSLTVNEISFLISTLSNMSSAVNEAFKRELVMLKLIFADKNETLQKTLHEQEMKLRKKSGLIAQITTDACIDLFKRVSAEISSDWQPALLLNWDAGKRHRHDHRRYIHEIDQEPGGRFFIDMHDIVTLSSKVVRKKFLEEPGFADHPVVGSFVTDKWEFHLVASVCHLMSHAAQWHVSDKKTDSQISKEHDDNFLFFYANARNFLCNPSLKEAKIGIGDRFHEPGAVVME